MEFKGDVAIQAPREKVYAFLTDPNQVTQCAPGLQSVEIIDDDHFKCTVKAGVGMIKGTFNFDIDVHGAAEAVGDVAEDGVDATKEGAKATKSKSKDLCSVSAAGLGSGSAASALALFGMAMVARIRRRGRKQG